MTLKFIRGDTATAKSVMLGSSSYGTTTPSQVRNVQSFSRTNTVALSSCRTTFPARRVMLSLVVPQELQSH